MSDSVVVNLLALFILLMSLLATSCIVAFLRKRWLAARRWAPPHKRPTAS